MNENYDDDLRWIAAVDRYNLTFREKLKTRDAYEAADKAHKCACRELIEIAKAVGAPLP